MKSTGGKWRVGWVGVLISTMLCLCGCATRIVPPNAPANSTTVCVVKYNRFHSSLVLPAAGGAVEYAYGEWKWFALKQNRSYRILPVLLVPRQGTLGRRYLPDAPEQAAKKMGAQTVLAFEVSNGNAAELQRDLNARFAAHEGTEIYNSDYEIYFVKDPARYWGFHNCNHELTSWLHELGCGVKGPVMWGRFRLDREVVK